MTFLPELSQKLHSTSTERSALLQQSNRLIQQYEAESEVRLSVEETLVRTEHSVNEKLESEKKKTFAVREQLVKVERDKAKISEYLQARDKEVGTLRTEIASLNNQIENMSNADVGSVAGGGPGERTAAAGFGSKPGSASRARPGNVSNRSEMEGNPTRRASNSYASTISGIPQHTVSTAGKKAPGTQRAITSVASQIVGGGAVPKAAPRELRKSGQFQDDVLKKTVKQLSKPIPAGTFTETKPIPVQHNTPPLNSTSTTPPVPPPGYQSTRLNPRTGPGQGTVRTGPGNATLRAPVPGPGGGGTGGGVPTPPRHRGENAVSVATVASRAQQNDRAAMERAFEKSFRATNPEALPPSVEVQAALKKHIDDNSNPQKTKDAAAREEAKRKGKAYVCIQYGN